MAVITSDGSKSLLTEREKLEFESVPEYIREPKAPARELHSLSSRPYLGPYEDREREAPALPKSEELETLWPSIHASEFLPAASNKRHPAIYVAAGFAGGFLSCLVLCGLSAGLSGYMSQKHDLASQDKQIVVSRQAPGNSQNNQQAVVTARQGNQNAEVVVPLFTSYTVKDGDTLAGIALQAYKRATPRLLDEICEANGMKNANVLSLGQTINLPEYHPQPRQVAAGAATPQ